MSTPFKVVLDEIGCPSSSFSSVSNCNDVTFAATFCQSVFCKHNDGKWSEVNQGLPLGVVVNRLQLIDGTIYACTNRGLFYYDKNLWNPTKLTIPCYQVMKQGEFFAAATEYGLRCKIGDYWKSVAYPNIPIYDLLITPQYYIIGFNEGISLYDRNTDSWEEFPLKVGITSLAEFYGCLIGVTSKGGLIQGNKKDGFTKISFEGLSIYSLKSTETDVYVCSSRGLFQLVMMEPRITLRSMLIGFPVTDINCSGECMYIATLNRGMKKVVFNT